MKQLIRRLSRVADSSASLSSSSSSRYSLLRSESQTSRRRRNGNHPGCNVAWRAGSAKVPEGHVPVYVGEEMERFVVSAEVLNHPVFVGLLEKSAQEYGYEQKGVLRIPCHVLVFERVMEALRLGLGCRELEDLLDNGNSLFPMTISS